ncbi:DUF5018 domain-containing protein [Runella zeae]|uniref:DUF5018 domain-containing protein n=1 Tax=Runella zeae TaxID=94255 RepID=UPI00048A72AC|nr:DUF5018 domain-containing protein [Runella zeae]
MPKFIYSLLSSHYYLFLVLILLFSACSQKQFEPTKSSAKNILLFSFESFAPSIKAAIDSNQKVITAVLPIGTDASKLTPTIVISEKATVAPASGVVQDFTKPVTYTITAEDGSSQSFVVQLSVAKSTAKIIKTFVFQSLNPNISADIDTLTHTIHASVPFSIALHSLTPTISVSENATISPASGTNQDFTKPVIYTVMAEDGSTQNYTVTLSKSKPTKEDFANWANQWQNSPPLQLSLQEVTQNETYWGDIKNGSIYLSKYQNGKEYVITHQKIPTSQISSIVEFNNAIWVATASGLLTITSQDTTLLHSKNTNIDFENTTSLEVFDNTLYCATKTTIYKLVQEKWQHVLNIPEENILGFTLYQNLIYVNTNQFLYKYDGVLQKFIKPVSSSLLTKTIKVNAKGVVWIGFWSGLIRFENNTFRTFSLSNVPSFPPNGLETFVIDTNDYIWMAWSKQGLVVFEEGKIIHHFLKSNSSLLSDNITNIKLKGGNMYIGFFNYVFGSNTNYGVAKITFN